MMLNCDVTLSVYPHWASLENMPDTVGIEPRTFGILAHRVRHIFQACPVWIYTQSNITSIICTMFVNIIQGFTMVSACEQVINILE